MIAQQITEEHRRAAGGRLVGVEALGVVCPFLAAGGVNVFAFVPNCDIRASGDTLECIEGWRVMEIIRDWGLPLEGLCGGACECATCHVFVDEAWFDKLPPPSEDEEDLLYSTLDQKPTSRLSCQIQLTDTLDGLVVVVPEAQV